jgi:hypothetical protein
MAFAASTRCQASGMYQSFANDYSIMITSLQMVICGKIWAGPRLEHAKNMESRALSAATPNCDSTNTIVESCRKLL